MAQDQWTAVDTYFDGLFAPQDEALTSALQAVVDAGMPTISVSPSQGKLLHVLARMHNVKYILEIGTLGGYSTIWMSRALPADGKLISLELDPKHASVARANIARANVHANVEVRVGKAIDSLPKLVENGEGPFDLVFIDADKASTPDYLSWAFRLTKPGSVIIIDNVVRNGAVSDPNSTNPDVQGVQKGLEMLAKDKRVIGTALQTVGSKGYDGFAIAYVTGSELSLLKDQTDET